MTRRELPEEDGMTERLIARCCTCRWARREEGHTLASIGRVAHDHEHANGHQTQVVTLREDGTVAPWPRDSWLPAVALAFLVAVTLDT